MNLLMIAAFLLFTYFGSCQSNPYFKDIDFKLYENGLDSGVAIDSIFEVVPESSVGGETKNSVRNHRRRRSIKHR